MSNIPIGFIMMWTSNNIPNNFLLCDGASYTISEYPELYSVIQDIYGGDSVSFNVPNLKGFTPIGTDSNINLNTSIGSKTVTITTETMPAHSHSATSGSYTGSHSHSLYYGSSSGGQGIDVYTKSSSGGRSVPNLQSAGSHSHTFTVKPTGEGQAHTNLSPYLSVHFIIKYK